jgi:hypothetical protein
MDKLENCYLQLLRIFFLVTTSIALAIMVIAFGMGIYNSIPREDGYYAQHYQELGRKTNAIVYLSNFLPQEDIDYLKKNAKVPNYNTLHLVSSENVNKKASVNFLTLFNRQFNSNGFENEESKSSNYLQWKKVYDGVEDKNLPQSKKELYDTNQLFWSLYDDFSLGMIVCSDLLQKKYGNKSPIYSEGLFNKVIDDYGMPSEWLRKTVNSSFKDLENRLSDKNTENVLRKVESYTEFVVSGVALGYFILVMFYFIFVKIERNLRGISLPISALVDESVKNNSTTHNSESTDASIQ